MVVSEHELQDGHLRVADDLRVRVDLMPSQTSVEQAASRRRLPATSTEQRRQRALMR